jgi:AraC family transcriptional regulator, ethanolamine operon transcriptional activator
MSVTELSTMCADESGTGEETPERVDYCSLEEMQVAAESEGWSIDYRQLQSGRLFVRSVSGECAAISLLDESVSGQIEAVGETPEGHITVVMPCGRKGLRINGKPLDRRGLCVLKSHAEMHAVTDKQTRVLGVHLPISLLRPAGRPDRLIRDTRLFSQVSMIEPSSTSIDRLRRLVYSAIYRPVAGRWQEERAFGLTTALAEVINECDLSTQESGDRSRMQRLHTIKRAREFIEAHLDEPIRMDQVCTYSATTIRQLERTFRYELQMSPNQYIRARRLAAVNRKLVHANGNGDSITQIAMDHGFSHLSRFAGAYRQQFGELPSETLQEAGVGSTGRAIGHDTILRS